MSELVALSLLHKVKELKCSKIEAHIHAPEAGHSFTA